MTVVLETLPERETIVNIRTGTREAAPRTPPQPVVEEPGYRTVVESIQRRYQAVPLRRRMATRLFDLVVTALALAVISPLLVVIALAIRLTSRGPVVYVHWRLGTMGRVFPCLKFRTMFADADRRLDEVLANDPVAAEQWAQSHKIKDDPRVTPIGNILRKTSLDELPQLVNVLLGHMSVVGPRPIVTGEVERYGDGVSTLLSIKPGMTGLWQVSGRNDSSYDERVSLDLAYVENRTLVRDLVICVKTGWQMLRPHSNGAY